LSDLEIQHPRESELKNKTLEPEQEMSFVSTEENKITKNTWLADSGASSHMTHCDKGMFNVEDIESSITIGDSKSLLSHKMGSIQFWCNKPQGRKTFILDQVKHVPDSCVSLISIPMALQSGLHIGNRGNHLFLQKGNFEIYFNKLFKTGRAFVCGIELFHMVPEFAAMFLES
jgi:hypothetical protein